MPNLPADVEPQTERQRPLRAIVDLGGYSSVYIPGQAPCFILKTASTPVRLFPLANKGLGSLKAINTSYCGKGIVYIEDHVRLFSSALSLAH